MKSTTTKKKRARSTKKKTAPKGKARTAGKSAGIPAEYDGLTIQQVQVLTRILAGERISTIADDMGIWRQTVYGWRNNPIFARALASERARLIEAFRDKTYAIAARAYDAIQEALEPASADRRGEIGRLALAFLDRTQLIEKRPPEEGGTSSRDELVERVADFLVRAADSSTED